MSPLFERFSSRENLKRAYEYVKNELAYSTLSVNPINHPSLTAVDALGDQFFVALEHHLRDGTYTPEKCPFFYIPKDNFGLRPICSPSLIDRIVYQAIFNQKILGLKIDGQLSDKVCFTNRVNEDEKAPQYLTPYYGGWGGFLEKQAQSFKRGFVWKLELDIQQYYEHIPIKRLLKKLRDDFGIKDESLLALLERQLCAWAEYEDLPQGIPQGPDPSAILGNAYLASLDRYAEDELSGKSLRYFRYADDVVLMGKTKQAVLRAVEQMVSFLRRENLTLNEKTKLQQLEDASSIEERRIFSDYDDNSVEIPEDDFAQISLEVPEIVEKIISGARIERCDLSKLKYFLKTGAGRDFLEQGGSVRWLLGLIQLLPLRPSLTVPIIKYVSEARKHFVKSGSEFELLLIDFELRDAYRGEEISQWAKFWVLKLLMTLTHTDADLSAEASKIISQKENSLFKVVCFYYRAIRADAIQWEEVRRATDSSESDVEKSLYSFFYLYAFKNAKGSAIRNCLENLLDSSSHELNLIGSYLCTKTASQADIAASTFSRRLLNLPVRKKSVSPSKPPPENSGGKMFLVHEQNLIPTDSAQDIFGISRPKKIKHTVQLKLPESFVWDKVTIKIKDGLREVGIFYDDEHLDTADFVACGFSQQGDKNPTPSTAWSLLQILSVFAVVGPEEATPQNLRDGLARETRKAASVQTVHQTKRSLVKGLQSLFGTKADPFYSNRDYYQPKFKIVPSPDMRNADLRRQGGSFKEEPAADEE